MLKHAYINWINTRETHMQRFHHNLHSGEVYRSDQWEKSSQRKLLFNFKQKGAAVQRGSTLDIHIFLFFFCFAFA